MSGHFVLSSSTCYREHWYTYVHSIYVITRCACVRTSVGGCPEARRGVPVDITRHKARAHCGRADKV